MRDMNLEKIIKSLIDLKKEGDYWDYKQEWYKDNERLLHDILCFANTVHDKDCYIIVGVSDNGEIIGVNEDNRMKQVGILDMLANTVFAGDNTPEIMVDTIKIEGKEIDVLTIFNTYNVPFYLKSKCKKYNNIKEGYIYVRTGDRNTPISQNATIQQIEMLWKKRLGLTQPPLNQIVSRLVNKSEWGQNGDTYYNIFKPEFKLVEEYDDDDGTVTGQFYIYTQTNSRYRYKTLKILCSETILNEFELIVLDSGRYKTPVPESGFVGYDEYGVNHKFTYRYYTKDSIRYKLQQFFFDSEDMEEVHAKRRFDEVVLYYENEEEKDYFEFYIENKQSVVEQYIAEADNAYFSIDTGNDREKRIEKYRLSTGLALKKLLQEFRQMECKNEQMEKLLS